MGQVIGKCAPRDEKAQRVRVPIFFFFTDAFCLNLSFVSVY